MDQPTGMRIEQVIYTTEKVPDIVYYGDIPDDPIPTVSFIDEKKLSTIIYWLTGWRYSYTMIITNE